MLVGSEVRFRLLADLGRSLCERAAWEDASVAVARVAELVVPACADACVIELGEPPRRVIVQHRHPELPELDPTHENQELSA